jgi:serralysin
MSKTMYACITQDPTRDHIIKHHANKNTGDIHIARAAFQKNALWPQKSDIKIHFMRDSNYTDKKAKWVETVISKYIEPLVNLNFHWNVSQNNSNIRISFDPTKGAFSNVGKEALSKSKSEVTMNLGWTDQDEESSDAAKGVIGTGLVVVHEFGHLLGMIHEHQRGDAPFKWNKEFVYAEMLRTNKWSHQQVDENIFDQTAMNTLNASKFDPHSVMEYIFPNSYFLTPPNLEQPDYLSNLDIIWISKMYPTGKPLPVGIKKDGTGTNPFGGSTGTGTEGTGAGGDGGGIINWFNGNWYWLIIGALIFTIIIYAITRKM